MAIYLTETDVTDLLTMEMALGAVEGVLLRQAQGRASNLPRRRLRSAGTTLHVMSGADGDWMGLKSYTVGRAGARFFINLFNAQTGELVALIEADRIGQMRTGAASGVATKYLAPEGATSVGIYGTGWQAQSQLAAVCAVRRVERVLVYSRDPANRERFCREMGQKLDLPVILPVANPEEAAAAEILITITTSREPVMRGEWLRPGTHLNAAGGNSILRREFDERVIERATLLTVDSIDQARLEAGELVTAVEKGLLNWERLVELRSVVGRDHPGRQNAGEITIFKSLGLAIEDIATAALVYEAACQQKRGREI